MADRTTDAEQVHDAVLRRLEGLGTFRLAVEASETARALALTRLAAEHPGASQHDLIIRFLRQAFRPDELPPTLR